MNITLDQLTKYKNQIERLIELHQNPGIEINWSSEMNCKGGWPYFAILKREQHKLVPYFATLIKDFNSDIAYYRGVWPVGTLVKFRQDGTTYHARITEQGLKTISFKEALLHSGILEDKTVVEEIHALDED